MGRLSVLSACVQCRSRHRITALPGIAPISSEEIEDPESLIQRLEVEYRAINGELEQQNKQTRQLEDGINTLEAQLEGVRNKLKGIREENNAERTQLSKEKDDELENYRALRAIEKEKLTNVNAELKKRLKETERESIVSVIEGWKPLQKLAIKFSEFDVSNTGFISREEFNRMMIVIDTQTRTAPLYSLQDQHSASSVWSNDKPGNGHHRGTLDSAQSWSAAKNNRQQWYQIDAIVNIWLAGVVIQGRHNHDQWVTKFQISHSVDGKIWHKLLSKIPGDDEGEKEFDANHDRDSKARVMFDDPIQARFVRLHPIEWHSHISLRMDVLWVEDFEHEIAAESEAQERRSRSRRQSEFAAHSDELFELFDVKKTGDIDLCEFLAVVDREAIRNPRQHPHTVIKETMRYLLHGGKDAIQEVYTMDMLGKESLNIMYNDTDEEKSAAAAAVCCLCSENPGIFGYAKNEKCTHRVCAECLGTTLECCMSQGLFPAYCPGCQAENNDKNIDSYITGPLLRSWVDNGIVELKFAVRFNRQQDRFLQDMKFEAMMKTEGMRKCPGCGFVILKNEGCNYIKCPECKTELCWQTGLVAGKGPGQCGGGHSCHY